MRYELKRIPLWPFIKVAFFINLLIGFVFGLFYSPIVSVIMMVLTATPYLGSAGVESAPASWGMLLFTIPFISAFLAGCVNTLIGLILVLAYNMFSVLLGGLEFELEPVRHEPTPPAPTAPVERPSPSPYYAAPDGVIPPPPPPPPVRSRTDAPEPTGHDDKQVDTGRITPYSEPLTSEVGGDMLSEPGEPTEPFASEPAADRPDDSDTEGTRNS